MSAAETFVTQGLPPPRFIFARDVAKMRGVSIRSAQRWLAAFERKHPLAVGRIGLKLYTTEAALREVAPRWSGPEGDVEQRLKDCEDTVDDLARRLRALESEVRRNAARGATSAPKG